MRDRTMTDQREFLKTLVEALQDHGIPYMLSGSICSSLHGHPRATNDADIIIDPDSERLLRFVDDMAAEYYVSKPAALQALEKRSMFNVIHVKAGWKADLIIKKKRPFSRQEFDRKQIANVMGMRMFVVSPEDSILSKLEWSKGRDSQVQSTDTLGIIVTQGDMLDYGYLREWADKLNVLEELERLIARAAEFGGQ